MDTSEMKVPNTNFINYTKLQKYLSELIAILAVSMKVIRVCWIEYDRTKRYRQRFKIPSRYI